MTTDMITRQPGSSYRCVGSMARALLVTALTLTFLAALLPSAASSRTTRLYETSFGFFKSGFGSPSPDAIAVDQSTGDVYVASRSIEDPKEGSQPIVSRFSATGAPKDFTAGPDAGSNTLTGFPASNLSVAVDNSGGPLNGTIYVLIGGLSPSSGSSTTVKAFASTGASTGAIGGFGLPGKKFSHELCGAAVDQSSGALYVSEINPDKIWRFAPSSPSGAVDDSDYTLTGITADNPCDLAANSSSVYSRNHIGTSTPVAIERVAASSFTTDFSNEPVATPIDTSGLKAEPKALAVDPKNGDLYVNGGSQVAVFDSAGFPLYTFGSPAYFNKSAGLAVRSATSGPAARAYVADPGAVHEVDVFGGLTKVPTFTHAKGANASFGPDGTSGSSFSPAAPGPLAFDQAPRRLYAADEGVPGIYGFDASAPPSFPPLGAFSPLSAPGAGVGSGLAVDNTALASAGNLYLASQSTDLLYGWDAAGSPLGGAFPVDPAVAPGAPDGSPKDLCGAAVDSEGDIWVANSATKRILEYSSSGSSLPGTIDTSSQGSPCNLAFDADDDLYVGISGGEAHKSGIWKYTAASGHTSATRVAQEVTNATFAVDPSTDFLYVSRGGLIDVYDPTGNLLDEFAPGSAVGAVSGVSVDATNGFVYIADASNGKVHAFPPGLLLPETVVRPVSGRTNTSATLNGLVNSQGIALSDCHFEYVSEAVFRETGFSDFSTGGSVPCVPVASSIPLDLEDHPVSATATGLTENTAYRFRLIAANADGTTSAEGPVFLSAGRPLVETTGSPVRTATTARLEGRVNAHGEATTYHFEYGVEGPCDTNPCQSTETSSAGSGEEVQLVSRWVEDLEPNTTYHYRLVADNDNPLGSGIGQGRTVTTRASDAPLSRGDFPGPPGSDRAYEQVSLPDTGGNPVDWALAVSDQGNRAFYRVSGGTPISSTGSLLSMLFAERTPNGWRSEDVGPPRGQLAGAIWLEPAGNSSLADQVALNVSSTGGSKALWRLRPSRPALKVFEPKPPSSWAGPVIVSEDASRVLARLNGPVDPAHPVPPGTISLYDVTSGSPRLVGLLPDGSIPPCDVEAGSGANSSEIGARARRWVSPDGSLAFFESCGKLHMRDLDAEQTVLIGPGSLVKSTPGAVFFATGQALESGDAGGTDVYRYDLDDGSLECITCVVPGLNANVAANSIAVAADGSRVYFTASNALLPGAATRGIYRINVLSGDLAYVADPGAGAAVGDNPLIGNAISPDGAAIIFVSDDPDLNAIGGQQNGGTQQYYRYDDRDRSLTCLSCPQNGDAADSGVGRELVPFFQGEGVNRTAISADGNTFAFATSNRLLSSDQNSARPGQSPTVGTDVYEWRNGRLLLVTDGLTNWPDDGPAVSSVTPSGRDIFFTAAAQYTPDALDGYRRLYDARIGGGFEYPVPSRPCPLEVCQGTPRGAPGEDAPGTSSFRGPENMTGTSARRSCPKGKRRAGKGKKTRCVRKRGGKSRNRQRAKHDRRAQK